MWKNMMMNNDDDIMGWDWEDKVKDTQESMFPRSYFKATSLWTTGMPGLFCGWGGLHGSCMPPLVYCGDGWWNSTVVAAGGSVAASEPEDKGSSTPGPGEITQAAVVVNTRRKPERLSQQIYHLCSAGVLLLAPSEWININWILVNSAKKKREKEVKLLVSQLQTY